MNRQVNLQSLEQRVLRFIREHGLFSGQTRILAAVSGGPDSVCLLNVLCALSEQTGVEIHVAHLDHMLRGMDSAADARYVARLCERLGVPSVIDKRDVKAYRARHRLSLEEAAREVRYSFLAEAASSLGLDRVVTGHTADDNVETILMHLIRGSGSRGMTGLRPESPLIFSGGGITVVRPLLEITRQETADYCRENGLEPRLDATNLSLKPLRNRLRQQLVPLMKSYNPRVEEALLRNAGLVEDDLSALNSMADAVWEEAVLVRDGAVTLDKGKILAAYPAFQRLLLRKAIEALAGNIKDIELAHIEAMMEALRKPAGKSVSLPGGLVFVTEYDRFVLAPDSAALCPLPVIERQITLNVPGVTKMEGWEITAEYVKPEQARESDDFIAWFDADKLDAPLIVRKRMPGDLFRPLGMGGRKKIGRFMIDEKIPFSWRDRVPLVCCGKRVVWVVGSRIDDDFKVMPETGSALRLEFRLTSGA